MNLEETYFVFLLNLSLLLQFGWGKGRPWKPSQVSLHPPPAWPAHYPVQAISLPSLLTMALLHSHPCFCCCSCCDLALTHYRDRHAAEKESKSQVASGRPEASAGQQMLLAPRVSWDQHRPQEYLFASCPQSQLGSLDAATV